jgi:glycosyltransferase involved in cell wall biosynthesis
MPKVSVIVPNYNHAPFLRQRIDTVLTQTFQDFELILLDDCSIDDSRFILSSYVSDTRVLEFNATNSGSTFKQWNKGVRLAHGQYIWIAESDDYADPHFLESFVAVLESKPEVVFASCRSWHVSTDGKPVPYTDTDSFYLKMPLARRFSILRDDTAIDRANTLLGIIPEGLGAVRRKIVRNWCSLRSASMTTEV